MKGTLTRRELILRTARLSALAALAGPSAGAAQRELDTSPDALTWHKAPCRFCGTGCGVMVGVKEGRVVAVKGDRFNPVNKGMLCAKGYYAGALLYGGDRLRYPMIRKKGKLVRASWEEAIDSIARRLIKTPKTFSIYGSGQWTVTEGYTAMKFLKGGLGNNHLDPNARLCMASAVVGMITTFGVDEPSGCYDDLDVCDTVIAWGNNWAETHPVLYSRFMNRRHQGESITLIDMATRRTRSTELADRYLQFVPHTDLAIANCICYQLLQRRTYDRDFVENRLRFHDGQGKVTTFAEYQASLQDYTPEKVSKLSGLSVGQLTMLGDVFSDPKRKVVSIWCMGVNQHTRGTWLNNLIYNVHLLAGKIGKPGSTPFSLTGQPSACGTCREVGTLAHALPGGRLVSNESHRKQVEDVWNCVPGALNPTPGFHTVKMFKALAAGDLTGMWVQVTNPAQSMPNLHETLARATDRFLVVSDIYPTVTTELASVVLPSAAWVEKNGMYGNTERRTQQWFKAVDPPGEARDDVWQMLAVAYRMFELGFKGMRDRQGNFLLAIRGDQGQEIEAWKWDVFKEVNVDRYLFNEYRNLSLLKHKDLAPYDAYVPTRGLRWPVVKKDDQWVETKRRFVEGEDPYVKLDEGISFYMAKAGDRRAVVWQRPYEPPPEMPDRHYPFWLTTGRVLEHWHTSTMTGRCTELKRSMPTAFVEIHPEDALALSVSDGDLVKLVSRRGSMRLRASVLGRSVPARGSVFVPFFDEGKLINQLTLDAFCPLSKEPDFKKCAVRVEAVV